MITVMLADDNKYALLHFSRLVDWEKLGFCLVTTAIDGNEAWEKCCEYSPDVIITDIQMPGLDGREFASKVKQKNPDALILFLSSYNEFDYARAAISLNVYDYILKQELTAGTLEKKLQEIKNTLNARTQKHIGHIIACFNTPIKELSRDYYERELPGTWGFLVIQQDTVPESIRKLFHLPPSSTEDLPVPEALASCAPPISFIARSHSHQWICFYQDSAQLKALIQDIKKSLSQHFSQSFSLMVFGNGKSIVHWREEYEKNLFLFDYRYFEGEGQLMYAQLYDTPSSGQAICLDNLRKAVLHRNSDDIQYKLCQVYRDLLHRCDLNLFTRTLNEIVRLLLSGDPDLFEHSPLDRQPDPRTLITARGTVQWFHRTVMQALQTWDQEKMYRSKSLAKAVRYIEQHYEDSLLSVETIAARAGVSVNHLNELFKMEQNTTAGKYLTQVRMEKAKVLLDDGITDFTRLSRMVGFNSGSYFAKVFRKYYGISPSEYQKGRDTEHA